VDAPDIVGIDCTLIVTQAAGPVAQDCFGYSRSIGALSTRAVGANDTVEWDRN